MSIVRCAFAVSLLAPTAEARVQDEPILPAVEPGFSIELIDEAPNLLWPSAVHALSDGSLLVAEDPMDMIGPTDQPGDRIWRYVIAEDGSFTRTEFARDLYAVFGLQEIDGAVYVMNMPHLTVLRDRDGDGVAEEREVLLDTLGPEAPGAPGGFNDHIVTGLRLGMDNWLYVSIGDKGVPGAVGRDGSRISLRGGGVVRLRPDGSELEVVASGTRNHLDVAMNELDHIFTHDNTDDGLGWWTRVTHIMPSGDYGYPWKYHDHRDRMLEPMVDFGGGSPCGGLAYRGGAWPAKYANNLFFCEWGDRVLRRFVVEPEGASYAFRSDHDCAKVVPGLEFRPLDVCESLDGRFLYIADWGYGGWRKDDRTGRLWRLRCDEVTAAAPIRTLRTMEQCLADLGHPNFGQRVRAQRGLRAFGERAIAPLIQLLTDSDSVLARRHAVWAIDQLGRAMAGEVLRTALSSGTASQSADTRRELVRALGSRRVPAAAEVVPFLQDADPMVRREAAIALGRIGDASASEALVAAFEADADPFLRHAIRESLRALGHGQHEPWIALARRYVQTPDEAAAAAMLVTFHQALEPGAVLALGQVVFGEAVVARRAAALEALASNHRRAPPWDGKWWGTQPARSSPPAQTVDWEATPAVIAMVEMALDGGEPALRAAAVRSVGEMREAGLLAPVRAIALEAQEPELVLSALRVLRELRDPGADGLVTTLLRRSTAPEEVRLEALQIALQVGGEEMAAAVVAALDHAEGAALVAAVRTLGEMGRPSAAASVQPRLGHGVPAVRAAACTALASLRGGEAVPALQPLLRDPDPEVRRTAVLALGPLEHPEVVPTLLPLLAQDELRPAVLEALASVPRLSALDAYLEGLVHRNPPLRNAATAALQVLRDPARPTLEQRATEDRLPYGVLPALQRLYSEPRPLLEWRFLGPFGKDRFVEVLQGTGEFPAQMVGYRDIERIWIPHRARAEDGFVDFEQLYDDTSEVCVYGVTQLHSEHARIAEMWVGSDDGIWVWVNGQAVHANDVFRGWTRDADRFELPLKAGDNRIVVRVHQGGGQWSFNAKVSEPGVGPLFAERAAPALTRDDYQAFALEHDGDAHRGERVFHDPTGPSCANCHQVRGVGKAIGPDLSSIATRYALGEIITHVLEPSTQIHESYKAVSLFLKDGRTLVGLIHEESPAEVVFHDTDAREHRLRPEDIELRKPSKFSAMPDDLVAGLNQQEFADLIAYLRTCLEALPEGEVPNPDREDR